MTMGLTPITEDLITFSPTADTYTANGDGILYYALPTSVTAAGMVAYKSGSNGLVIALANEASTMNWETANGGSESSFTGLNTAITNAGGTALPLWDEHWSSTQEGEDETYFAFYLGFGYFGDAVK